MKNLTLSAVVLVGFSTFIATPSSAAWVDGNPRDNLNCGDIWADAPTNVWCTNASGFLRHFDGERWTSIAAPSGENPRALWVDGGLIYVAGDSGFMQTYNPSTEMWTPVGDTVFPGNGFTSVVAFAGRIYVGSVSGAWVWRGAQWDSISVAGGTANIDDMWGSGAFDVYAAASNGRVLRYTADGMAGATGTFDDIFASEFSDPLNTAEQIEHVWGSGANDVYVLTELGRVAHYDGSAAPNGWTDLTGGPENLRLFDAHGTVGQIFGVASTAAVNAIGFYRLNAGQWEPLTGDIMPDGSPRAVWVFSDTDVFAAADAGASFRYDGTNVRILPNGGNMGLREVWSYSDNGLKFVAVGDRGNILTNRTGVLEVMDSDSFVDLNGIWGANKDHLWAVGDGGLVRHFNGTAWVTIDAGTTSDLWGVWGWAENQLIVCGDNSTLRQYNGSVWSDVPSPVTGFNYTAIDGVDADNYFVGTNSGPLVHNDAGILKEVFVSGTSERTNQIRMFSTDSAALAHGDGVARWTGSFFELDDDFPLPRSLGIAGDDGANLVATSFNGTGGTIHRFENGVWAEDWVPVFSDPFSGASNAGGESVVVGDSYVLVDTLNRLLVTSSDDGDDGSCDMGHCSLREAIDVANLTPGRDLIAFDIPGSNVVIDITSPLPTLTDAVVIDGTTQPTYVNQPVITLDGTLSLSGDGLVCAVAGNTVIRGLAIVGFAGAGVAAVGCDGLTIAGNIIGLQADGATAASNLVGVDIVGARLVTVGGPELVDRNIISGNTDAQVQTDSSDGVIEQNLIGLSITGSTVSFAGAAPTATRGVRVTDGDANFIRNNIISGNALGIDLNCAEATQILSNFIGTDGSGTAALGTSGTGVSVTGLSNRVGLASGAGRNVIAGNSGDGIIFPMNSCTQGTQDNRVQSNSIGIGPGGEQIGNGELSNPGLLGAGVRIEGANGVEIGSDLAEDQNEIAFNIKGGIIVNLGQQNTIGVNIIHDNDVSEIDIGGDARDIAPECTAVDLAACPDNDCILAQIIACAPVTHPASNTQAVAPVLFTPRGIGFENGVENVESGGFSGLYAALYGCVAGQWRLDTYAVAGDPDDPNIQTYLGSQTFARTCSPSTLVGLAELASTAASDTVVAVTLTSPDGSTSELSNPGLLAARFEPPAPPKKSGCAATATPWLAGVVALAALRRRRRR